MTKKQFVDVYADNGGAIDLTKNPVSHQLASGPKEQSPQSQQNFSNFSSYGNPMNSSIGAPTEPYISSYYMPSPPYQAAPFGIGSDGSAWSNSGSDQIHPTFLSAYAGQNAPNNYDSQYEQTGGAVYSSWADISNLSQQQQAATQRAANRKSEDFYDRQSNANYASNIQNYQNSGLEVGVQGLSLSDKEKDNAPSNINSNGNKMTNVGGGGTPPPSSLTVISSQPKKASTPTWASVASKPAKVQPLRRTAKTTLTRGHMDIGTWDGKNGAGPKPVAPPAAPRPAWEAPRTMARTSTTYSAPPPAKSPQLGTQSQVQQESQEMSMHQIQQQQQSSQQELPVVQSPPQQVSPQPNTGASVHLQQSPQQTQPQQHHHHSAPPVHHSPIPTHVLPPKSSPLPVKEEEQPEAAHSPGRSEPEEIEEQCQSPVLEQLVQRNQYNPAELDLDTDNARFFVIKSYSEDDVHRSIKYEIWCSTEHGNKRLEAAFKEQKEFGYPIYFLFSVNGTGHFCGVAEMLSNVDYSSSSSVWAQDKWKGQIKVKWIYVKDVPNNQLRHIRLENNEGKPVTKSRDTQEVPLDKGLQVLKIIHSYRHSSSIFDDFTHYEKKQEETQNRRGGHDDHQNYHRGGGGGYFQKNYDNYQGGGRGGYQNQYYQSRGGRGRGYNNYYNNQSYGGGRGNYHYNNYGGGERGGYGRDRGYGGDYGRGRGGYGGDRGEYGGGRGNYGGNRGNYGGDRENYGGDRGGYGRDRGGYGRDRGSYGGDRGGYGGERGGYGGNRGGYGGNRGGYGGNREDFGGDRGDYVEDRVEYSGGRADYSGDREDRSGDRGGYGGDRGNYGGEREDSSGRSERGGSDDYGGGEGGNYGGREREGYNDYHGGNHYNNRSRGNYHGGGNYNNRGGSNSNQEEEPSAENKN